MFNDPHGVYRLPRAAQVELLGWMSARASPGKRSPAGVVASSGREYHNPDPEQGRSMARPSYLVAVSTEAKTRGDRFRVS